MSRMLSIATIIAFTFITDGASAEPPPPPSNTPVVLDKIVALIDDAIIFRSDVVARARPHLARSAKAKA